MCVSGWALRKERRRESVMCLWLNYNDKDGRMEGKLERILQLVR